MAWGEPFGDTGTVATHVWLSPPPSGEDQGEIVYAGAFGDGDVIFRIALDDITGPPVAVETDPEFTNIFCAGHCWLTDGRLLVTGGQLPGLADEEEDQHEHGGMAGGGERACWIYHPRTRAWIRTGSLNLAPDGAPNSGGRWYPTCVTLPDGRVLAVGGHPDIREEYHDPPNAPGHRHNNNIPEMFSPSTETWTYLPDVRSAPAGRVTDSYPRIHMLPNGTVFFATDPGGTKRHFDPYGENFVGEDISFEDGTESTYSVGSEGTSVLLPLLPPDYEPRVLICGGKTAWRIHLGQGPQAWKKLDRGELEGIERIHSCAVLLPTGRVFVSGGITRRDEPGPPGAALIPEVYDPGIDWDENEYDHGPFSSDSTGSWEALSGEPAEVARGYHSVALLLPDGRVWTAGSTDTAGLIAGSGVGSIAEGGSTLTLSSGEFGASAEGKEILVLGAGTPDDETNEPTDLRAVISDVVSATEATLDRAAGAGVSDAGVWWGWIDESRVEIYSPGYVGAANRPVVSTISSATYEETFTVTLENPQTIERVALIRCGTVTHAFDSDQRYVALEFVQSGDDETLTVTAPPSPQIAPPGNYMLWVVGGNERVAARAPFIRIADQEAVFGANKSNFSLPEVTAMAEAGDGEARFADALLLDFRGFLLHEIGDPLPSPEFELSFEAPLAGMPPGLTLEAKAPVTQTDDPDRAQHVVYPIDVVFSSDDAFESFTDEQIGVVQVRARVGERSFDLRLVLMRHSTPFMTDVRPDLQNPYWLSTDLRVFKMHPGDEKPSGDPSAPVAHGSDPFAFLDDLLGAYRQNPSAGSHPFDDLSENESLEMFPTDEEGPVFNYAVARVRYFAPDDHPAPGVRVFFRIFTTVGTAVEYDTATSYRREGLRESARPLLGKEGASIVSVPFFAEERVTPGGAMGSQPDDRNVQGLEGQAPQQYVGYFGCWLDNNQPDPQFPRFPLDDGPFTDVFFPVLSIQELMAGLHQCLVAEIHYWPVGLEADPILAHASPATSDKLAQRNLAFGDVANPGVVDATRTFHHSFELKAPAFAQPLDLSPRVNAGPEAVRTSPDASRGRLDPDELILWAPGLPDGSTVELYLPTVDAGRLLGLVERSPLGAARFEVRDLHTVAVELRPVVFVPVPGGANENLEGLISVTLPKGIVKEEVFEVVVQQWSGKSRRVVGSFELSIHVDSSDALLPRDMKRLSLLRHIAKSMPPKDRWYRVFDRWIDRAAERVRAFGGDPDEALPSPGGPGGTRPGSPDGGGRWVEGKIARLVYDCFGDFAGFVLDLCPGERRFASREAAVESLARRACADRSRVRVYPHGDRSDRFWKIEIGC